MDRLPKSGFLTPRQILTALADQQTTLMHNGATEGAQVGRHGDTYYVCGPEFAYLDLDLAAILTLEATEGGSVDLANEIISDEFPTAQIFVCHGLQDAIKTLTGLFAAHAPK